MVRAKIDELAAVLRNIFTWSRARNENLNLYLGRE